MELLGLFLVLMAGVGASVHGAIGFKILDKINNNYIPGLGFCIVTIPLFTIVVMFTGGFPDLSKFTLIPWWCVFGGFFQAMYFVTISICPPRIGVAMMAIGLLVGQTLGGLIIDGIGLLGVPTRPISSIEFIGAVILIMGASIMTYAQIKQEKS